MPARISPHRLKEKEWNMIYQANEMQRQAGRATVISNKTDFKPEDTKKVTIC
jgi:hypothetical protein